MKKIFLLLIVLLSLVKIIQAGVYMEIWESINNEEPIITYHTYEDNVWKIEDTNGLITIIDFDKDKLIVIYEKEHVYSVETLSNIVDDMKMIAEKKIGEDYNKKERTKFKKVYIGKESINNIRCNHYEIYESDNKIEEVWLSDLKILEPLELLFSKLKEIGKPTSEAMRKLIN